MRRLYVENDSAEQAFSSLSSAIAAVSRGPRRSAAQVVSEKIKGLTILSANWSNTTLHLLLSENKALSFFLSDGKVESVVGTAQDCTTTDEDASPVTLCFSDGTEVMWDPGRSIQPWINKKALGVFPSTAWLFFYAEQCPILMLSGILITNRGWRLHWSESD